MYNLIFYFVVQRANNFSILISEDIWAGKCFYAEFAKD